MKCRRCGKEALNEGFGYCRTCYNNHIRPIKICTQCGAEHRTGAKGLCLSCYGKKRYRENKDSMNAYGKAWRARNGDADRMVEYKEVIDLLLSKLPAHSGFVFYKYEVAVKITGRKSQTIHWAIRKVNNPRLVLAKGGFRFITPPR